jgi:hypothetical protein
LYSFIICAYLQKADSRGGLAEALHCSAMDGPMGRGVQLSDFQTLADARRRAKIESVAAEAEALIHEFGAAAYLEARRRQHKSSSDAMARDWERVALAVACRLGTRILGSEGGGR